MLSVPCICLTLQNTLSNSTDDLHRGRAAPHDESETRTDLQDARFYPTSRCLLLPHLKSKTRQTLHQHWIHNKSWVKESLLNSKNSSMVLRGGKKSIIKEPNTPNQTCSPIALVPCFIKIPGDLNASVPHWKAPSISWRPLWRVPVSSCTPGGRTKGSALRAHRNQRVLNIALLPPPRTALLHHISPQI